MKIFGSKYHCHYIYFCTYTEVWTRIGKFTQEWQSRRKWTRDFTEFFTLLRRGKCGRRISDLPGNKAHSTAYSYCTTRFEVTLLNILFYEQQAFWLLYAGEDLCCSKPYYTHMIMWNFYSLLFCIKFSIAVSSKAMKNTCPSVVWF